MATGSGLGGVMAALMPLIAIVTILKGRRKRKREGADPAEAEFQKRRDAARETERRMAAYLAQRDPSGYDADISRTEQEIKR